MQLKSIRNSGLVGREWDLPLLVNRRQQATDFEGQVVASAPAPSCSLTR